MKAGMSVECEPWSLGSLVEVYSVSRATWYPGVVIEISHDAEGGWLHIEYRVSGHTTMSKQIQRFDPNIRELARTKVPTKGEPATISEPEESSAPDRAVLLKE